MARSPQGSVSVSPSRAGQLLRGAGQLSSLVTITPALNLIVAGVNATPIDQGISLSVPPELADCITVWLGYDPMSGNSVQTTFTPSPSWPASAQDQPTRRIFGLIKWGAGGGQQYVECDVGEGCGVVVPCATCEVYAYSEQTALIVNGKEVDPAIQSQPTWSLSVHASPGRTAINARRTRQVVQPAIVPADVLPPNPVPRRPSATLAARAADATIDRFTQEQQQSWITLAMQQLHRWGGMR